MADLGTRTAASMFVDRIEATPDRQAFAFPEGDGWGKMTWKEAGEKVKTLSAGLKALGLEGEQRVGIFSHTCIEWILADIAVLCAGGATTTVYPSNTPDECQYILDDSQTVMIFAESDEHVEKLVEVRDQLPKLSKVITFEGAAGHDGWVITLADLEKLGAERRETHPNEFAEDVAAVQPDHLATLIYTSGTTGKPKGVELTHDCWVFEGEGINKMGLLNLEDHQYLWLPLSHSFGKVLEMAQLDIGFATTVDGRIPKLVENLAVVKPTFMAAAPRIFEKVYNKIVTGARESGGLKLKIFEWSLKVGKQVSQVKQNGGTPGGLLGLKFAIADKLVFSKLRALFGGNIRFFISGSAPLSRDMAEFFHAADILILEGYGLTESSAASFVNRPDSFKFGTVGQAVPGVEVKLDPSDGEILLGGRGIMRGYHNLPDVTAETLEDGWLRTGDIGKLDDSGYLRITDRKKDLIKTSGGKYVAPQKLESKLKALCPYLSQVLVHGNARNFCSALVTLDEEGFPKWATEHGKSGISLEDAAKDPAVIAMVQAAVDELNSDLASYETIKKFAILPKDFTIEDGLMTPSMKVKRKAVEQTYKDVLDGFYAGAIA